MTERETIAQTIRALYRARIGGDLAGTMQGFADDATFEFNGKGTDVQGMIAPADGKPAIASTIDGLIKAFRFDNWTEIDLIVDGETGVLRWKADVTHLPNGKTAHFDVCDVFRFRAGKIVSFHQFTDSAQVLKIAR